MYSVGSLLRSCHSVGSESDTEKDQAEVTDIEKEKERESRETECIPSKACFEAIIQSEAIATLMEETDEEK
jgi:hypothetical protein